MKLIQTMILSCLLMFNISSYAETFAEIQEKASQGNALAQAKLGAMYQLGENGVSKNTQRSAKWMLKAAEQGLVEAEVFMAALYDSGLGVKLNIKTANQWYEKAARQKHGTALAMLGRNDAAKGSIAFDYKMMRIRAAKQIPREYSKRFLRKKL